MPVEQWSPPGMGTSPPRKPSCATAVNSSSSYRPEPFFAAEYLEFPSLGISNFTWHLIYTHLFGKTGATDRIAEAYRAADCALPLPLYEPMTVFRDRREVGLVARPVTRDQVKIRRRCGLPEGRPLVYIGGGRSLDPAVFQDLWTAPAGCTLLVPSWIDLPGTVRIPPGETETQDWIAACDLAVLKPGYSTIAEAIQGCIPMVLFRRDGFSEGDHLIRGVETLGFGREIPIATVLDGSWTEDLENLLDLTENFDNIDGLLKRDGTKDCIDVLREMV